ncbi:MAG: D-2-hydroxyacid dehydrogenase, partial [Deltaproteobacteria bacterium]|nr:D-2-hydroxyacid dehydrogenase [Deltaproteobacteria bacterium]
MRKLKWIHCTRGGVYSFLTPSVVERSIEVTCSQGIHGTPFSEVALSLMFCLATRLPRCWEAQRSKIWNMEITAGEVFGKTLGIVGLGRIGNELARKAKALGLRVIATKRVVTEKPESVDELGPPEFLPKLLSQSDFVVLCLPSVPSTKNILGENELRSMKRSA